MSEWSFLIGCGWYQQQLIKPLKLLKKDTCKVLRGILPPLQSLHRIQKPYRSDTTLAWCLLCMMVVPIPVHVYLINHSSSFPFARSDHVHWKFKEQSVIKCAGAVTVPIVKCRFFAFVFVMCSSFFFHFLSFLQPFYSIIIAISLLGSSRTLARGFSKNSQIFKVSGRRSFQRSIGRRS